MFKLRNSEKLGSHEASTGDKKVESKIQSGIDSNARGMIESLNSNESAEFSDGNVSEKSTDKKDNVGDYSGSSSSNSGDSSRSKTPPSIDIMRIEIETRIKKEIVSLEQEIAKFSSKANFSPYKLNESVSRVRYLKDILANLAYASLETIKNWWSGFFVK